MPTEDLELWYPYSKISIRLFETLNRDRLLQFDSLELSFHPNGIFFILIVKKISTIIILMGLMIEWKNK